MGHRERYVIDDVGNSIQTLLNGVDVLMMMSSQELGDFACCLQVWRIYEDQS